EPVVATRGISKQLNLDMYSKGALFLHTLRSVVNDDKKWWTLLHGFYQHFKYKNILTEDVAAWFSHQTGTDLTPVFNQYLRRTAIPRLELKFDGSKGEVSYRWKVDEPRFAMPVKVGMPGNWQLIHPTANWQTMKTSIPQADFTAATDLYFIDVEKES